MFLRFDTCRVSCLGVRRGTSIFYFVRFLYAAGAANDLLTEVDSDQKIFRETANLVFGACLLCIAVDASVGLS